MTLGRPTLYRAEYAEQAEKLSRLGAIDEEMADFFGVTRQTLDNWKREHPEFFAAIKKGKIEADANVADRLYKRAMGYSHEAVKIFLPQGAAAPVYADYTEHYPPDTTAAIFWLKNRQPEKWRDKTERENTHNGNVTLTVEQRKAQVREMLDEIFAPPPESKE